MADVQTTDINTKPTVTAIDSNDQIYISDGGTALKKISYTNLAKAIIEQYNASQLAGATKTIQAAFNELNSKTKAYDYTAQSGSFLDWVSSTFTTNGEYYVVIATLNGVGLPRAATGIATVTKRNSDIYVHVVYGAKDEYITTYVSNAWTEWTKYPTRAEVDTLNSNFVPYNFKAGDDIFTVVGSAQYRQLFKIGSVTGVTNMPSDLPDSAEFMINVLFDNNTDKLRKKILLYYYNNNSQAIYSADMYGTSVVRQWVKQPTRSEVDALNSNLGTYLSTTRVEFKGLQDSETVNSGSITVTKAGLYLVNFKLAHCGANNITNVGAYWNVDLRNSNDTVVSQYNQARATIAIPLAKVWDYEVNAIGIYNLSAGGIYHAKFQNKSGIATDSGYNSGVSIFMKYLGTV